MSGIVKTNSNEGEYIVFVLVIASAMFVVADYHPQIHREDRGGRKNRRAEVSY